MVGMMHSDLRIQKECCELMILHGWTSLQVRALKDIPDRTLRTWRAHYFMFGRTPAMSKREREKLGPRLRNRKITIPLKLELEILITQKPWLYLDEVQLQLIERTNIKLSTSAIYKVLTSEMRWSLQVAEVAARERNEIDRANHQAVLNEITNDPAMFVFVDETSKDKNTMYRKRLWRPINESGSISRYFSDFAENSYTMIGVCDLNGFVPQACELIRRKRNAEDNDNEAGTIDAERFVEWVQFKLVPTLGVYALGEPRSVVVMDNATIHKDIRVYNLIIATGALLIFQSAYSPDLDPIEFCFHQYKAYLRRHRTEFYNDAFLAHYNALGSVSTNNMRHYYRKVGGIRNIPPDEVENVKDAQFESLCLAVLLLQQQQQLLLLQLLQL